MKGTRYIDGILVTQEQLENTERYKTEAIKERFGSIFKYGIVRTDNVSQPLSITSATSSLATVSPGEAYTDFDRTEPSSQYGSYGERIYVKESLPDIALKNNGGNRHLFVCYIELHKNRKLDESGVAFYTEKQDSYVIAQLSNSELDGLILNGSVFITECDITAQQTDLLALTTDELNDTFLGSSNYVKVGGILDKVHITVTSTNSLYLGTVDNLGNISNSYNSTTRQIFLLDSNVMELPGGLEPFRMTTVNNAGVLTQHSNTLATSGNMTILVAGSASNADALHSHTLAVGATDVTASVTLVNRALNNGGTPISANVTSNNLNTLTGGTSGATALHKHLLADGADDVTATAAEVNILGGATLSTAELNRLDWNLGDERILFYDSGYDRIQSCSSASATDSNMTILVSGSASNADALHRHASDALVAAATLSVAGTTITLSGLDISSHNNTYRVVMSVKKDATGGSPATARIYFNNNTTASAYSTSYISTNGAVVGTGAFADPKLADIPHNTVYYGDFSITLLFGVISWIGLGNSIDYAAGTSHGFLNTGTETNLTRIDLVIASGNFIAGSSVKVFKY